METWLAEYDGHEESENVRRMRLDCLGRLADKEAAPFGLRLASDLNYLEAPYTLTSPYGWGILDLD